jgi:hypothetical protein
MDYGLNASSISRNQNIERTDRSIQFAPIVHYPNLGSATQPRLNSGKQGEKFPTFACRSNN